LLVGLGPGLEKRTHHLLVAIGSGCNKREEALARPFLNLVPHLGSQRHEQRHLLLPAMRRSVVQSQAQLCASDQHLAVVSVVLPVPRLALLAAVLGGAAQRASMYTVPCSAKLARVSHGAEQLHLLALVLVLVLGIVSSLAFALSPG